MYLNVLLLWIIIEIIRYSIERYREAGISKHLEDSSSMASPGHQKQFPLCHCLSNNIGKKNLKGHRILLIYF